MDVVVSWGSRRHEVWGLIDSGADTTHIPRDIAQLIRLRPIRELPVIGVEGRAVTRLVYIADVSFEGLLFPAVEVVESSLDFVLVGRDLLNDLAALLDGPAQEFSFRDGR